MEDLFTVDLEEKMPFLNATWQYRELAGWTTALVGSLLA